MFDLDPRLQITLSAAVLIAVLVAMFAFQPDPQTVAELENLRGGGP